MKSNQKYINKNNDGVSALVGVILMIAITIAISATVYIYVTRNKHYKNMIYI